MRERVGIAARLLLIDLARRRIALLLLFVVPALFDAVVLATTAPRPLRVTLGALVEDEAKLQAPDVLDVLFASDANGSRELDERTLSLAFLGTAAVSFLACFLAFNLSHKRRDADARLVLAGFRVHEVLLAKLAVLLVVTVALAAYEMAILLPWIVPKQPFMMFAGLFLGGLVYGCLGMLTGALVKNELEGVFGIVFLTNIDAGWLENPLYYAHGAHREIIRALPGYGPAQLTMVGAFTHDHPEGALARALGWCAVALAFGLLAFGARLRPVPSSRWHYAKVLVTAYLVWVAAFELVGRHAATLHTVDLTSAVDRAIPVAPAFVWPYEATYVVPLLALFVIRDWHRFNVAIVALLLANVTAFVVYLALPIAYPRPELGASLAERVLALEYAADFHPGANKLPSMHVAMSWIMVAAMWRQRSRALDVALGVLLAAITVSPVFVKQHLVIDVVAGVPWGLASWWAAGWIYARVKQPDDTPRAALGRVFTWARGRLRT